jgi:HlyD family secretion protein
LKKKIIAAVFILFLIIACIVIYFGQRPENQTGLFYSGTIESTNSELAFQVSGKVSAVHVREGQAIEKGQVLAELDSDEYKARLEIANAEFERATQQVEQLQSNLSVLRKTLPADVAKAEAGLKAASATLEDAARDRDRYGQLFRKGVISAKENERMTLRYDTAFAGNAEAEATLRQAKSNLSKIHSLEKEIEAGRAQIRAAKAAVDQASLQLKYSTLTAPYRGIITVRSIEPGEVITPTRQVLTLSDLSTVD